MRRSPSVVTPGNHDGVHLGHRALIDAAKRTADAHGWQTLAMCFEPHPTAVLAPERAPVLLTEMKRRIELLKGAGCDDVVVLPFDSEFSRMTPDRFVECVLLDACHAKGVVVGPDFHFGHKRSGNIATLRHWGEREGFTVELVEPVMYKGDAVSSTRLRRILREDGNVEDAAIMMARAHETTGLVVPGDKRGRQIGFPTANLEVGPLQLPKDGVYAVVARLLDEAGAPLLHGVANLGNRPTFEAGRSIEVHLFGFDGDLYGKRMRVGFVGRIRGEAKFDGLEALREQIDRDCDQAKNALQQLSPDLVRWI
jgi:riboflavin kinase/FMN adenylyltransferase